MVLAALAHHGWEVLVPFGEGHPYDLVVDLGGDGFLRIQCKTAWPERGCLIFNALSTDHGRGPQSYRGYADLFGVYFPPTGAVYLVPIDGVAATEGRLRLEPPRNNQKRGIRMAEDFAICRWSEQAMRDVAVLGRTQRQVSADVA
jgi:hypothetical protein